MRYALFKDVVKRQRRKKHKANHGGAAAGSDEGGEEGSDENDDEDQASGEEGQPERMTVPAPATVKAKAIDRATPGISQDPIWGAQDQDVQMDLDSTASATVVGASGGEDPAGIIPERYATLDRWGKYS